MSLFIDGIIFSLQAHGGITVYFEELLQRLRRDHRPATLSFETPIRQARPPEGSTSLQIRSQPARTLERYRASRLPTPRPTVFHSSYYRLPAARVPTVVTVHDFIYERQIRGPATWVHSAQKRRAVLRADVIICISASTRSDLLEFIPEAADRPVVVIPNGAADQFRPLPPAPAAGGRPFALFVGKRDRYKNFQLALQALSFLPDLELHCVGGGSLQPAEFAGHPESVRQRVRHLGIVTNDALNTLYNQAACLVYPSEYEGFGIPVLEAMKAGCPAVTIDCKAAIEVGGDALTIAAPDGEDLARSIATLLEPGPREAAIARGLRNAQAFSWERTYRETLEVYAQLGLPPGPSI